VKELTVTERQEVYLVFFVKAVEFGMTLEGAAEELALFANALANYEPG